MNVAEFVSIAIGASLILWILLAVLRQKEKARRKRDIDEPADGNPYFGTEFRSRPAQNRPAPKRKERASEVPCPTERETTADGFRFSPELFEHRARVLEKLEASGFSWFSHYSSVDCLHDQYGLEVCGIHEREDAVSILKILARLFPDWKPG